MKKKTKLNAILLIFLLVVLAVLVVLPEKNNADTTYMPGFYYVDPVWGIQVCECPWLPVSCFCAYRGPLPPIGN